MFSLLVGGLALLTGAAIPIQGSLNAQLSQLFKSPFLVGAFSAGSAALLLLFFHGIQSFFRGAPLWHSPVSSPPLWFYSGGGLAAIYLMVTLWTIPLIGVSRVMVLLILGQLLGALGLQALGFMQSARIPSLGQGIGVSLLMAGAFLILNR